VNSKNYTVATAVRVEYIKDSDDVYLVFQIVDEDFKKRIKQDWVGSDIELKLIDRKLIIDKEV